MNRVYVAGLKLTYRIFKLTYTLCCSLQSVAVNGADDREVAMAAVKHFKERRTEVESDIYFWEILEESEQLGRCLVEVAGKPFCTCC